MDISWLALLPCIIVTGTAIVVLVADLFVEGPDREGLGWIGMLGLGVAAHRLGTAVDDARRAASAAASCSTATRCSSTVVLCVTGILTLLMSMDYLRASIRVDGGEYYVQLLLAVLGMIVMAAANDLIVLFLGLELMSISVYVLAGIWRPELRSIGSGAEVLPARRLRLGLPALRHRHGVRRLRHHDARSDRPRSSRIAAVEQRPLALAAVGAAAGRLRLQGRRRAVPLLGARRLRGRADVGHGADGRRRQGRRLRRRSRASSCTRSARCRSTGPGSSGSSRC